MQRGDGSSSTPDGNESREAVRGEEPLASLARLAGELAHEFNNHLTAILGYSDLVAAQLEGADRNLVEDVYEILSAARRARGLTQQLLTFSGRQVLHPRTVDVNELVTAAAQRLQAAVGESVEISLELTPGLGTIEVDPAELESALSELAVNARDAMPSGGVLKLGTANVPPPAVLAADRPQASSDACASISVVDRGEGIPAEVLPRIFEPFFTTKRGAARKEGAPAKGLGLALVHGIVTQLGGHVRVESEVGAGTRFELVFPRREALAADSTSGASAGASAGTRPSQS